MSKKFSPTEVGKFHVFHGRHADNKETWYVYDTEDKRYVGGSFDRKKDAKKYAEGKQ